MNKLNIEVEKWEGIGKSKPHYVVRVRLFNIVFDSCKFYKGRCENRMEHYNKIWWKFYKAVKIRQGFYKDRSGNVYVGYIKSDSNFHYMRCGLTEHVFTHSDCKNLTPIDFKEGLDLWSKIRRNKLDELISDDKFIKQRRRNMK